LTRIQAFALDAHFTLEQVGRNAKGHFINFNGTAGIWRKECILDAGNWEGDTLTEDLDLSYRAQLKDWKFKYLEDVETPADLPVVISAARSQQFRWNKGGAENFRKSVMSVISAKNISFKTKFHGVMHLLNSSMFLCVFLVSLFSVPAMYIKQLYPQFDLLFSLLSFFVLSTIILFVCYWFTYKSIQGSGFDNFVDYIKIFFTFFSVALGFSLHNSIAVIEGHMGKRSEFVRTPKFNLNNLTDSWKGNKYLAKKLSPNMILEALLMLYFLFGMYSAIPLNDFGLFPFHLMLFVGFGFVFFKSLTARA
jgi:cellulose synthase/poly-beta-1,6-N-acetylglucosamine synthase-like glycosyltransferase